MAVTRSEQGDPVELLAQAAIHQAGGRLEAAIPAAREAVLRCALATGAADACEDGHSATASLHAEACRTLAGYLHGAGQLPEAAFMYQEAADLFGRDAAERSQREAQSMAHLAVACISELRSQPERRLDLLLTRYEYQARLAALQPGSEQIQADCAAQMARILQRRERYDRAAARYQEAIDLYTAAEPSEDAAPALAECHHQLAGILSRWMVDLPAAADAYAAAIRYYEQCTPDESGERADLNICRVALAEIEAAIKTDRPLRPLRRE